jgi:hypothetical protein
VNYGKVERERKREKGKEKGEEKEGKRGAKAYTMVGVKKENREKDRGRVRKLRGELETRTQGKGGRKGIGRKTETNERVWMNGEGMDGKGRRQGRREGGKKGWKGAKERYQGQRRQSLSRRRVQSRYPRRGKEEQGKRKKEGL